jgi:DNA-directed RNA polymerase specialized sigma24 family protein
LSYVEIATTMGIRHGTVGAFLTRAYRKMGQVADERDAPPPRAAQTLRGLFLGAEA